ncbi:MAG TPA: aminoacyl-tRNA hydrolase, partial [Burkholderiales bacterium]|nr:aminoacyl-tRNA hydrolase [Burkholderiales bacterium]
TRHNVGFLVVDEIARRHQLALAMGPAQVPETFVAKKYGETPLLVAKPLTFMNRSGDAVARFAQYYKIVPQRILVAYDELDLPPGSVRLKQGGGDAGHNGVHDIIEKLGSPDFVRLRIGVGRPPSAGQGATYVLKKAPRAQQALIDAAIDLACHHLPDIVDGQYQKAMNALHAHAP